MVALRACRDLPKKGILFMKLSQPFIDTWTPRALAVLRIVTAYLFLLHGSAKLLHLPHVAMFDALPVWSFIGFAGMLELVGGLMLIVGLFTRPVAFILSGQMAVAYFLGHASKGNALVPMLNQGEPAVMFCFVFLFLSVAGAGAWAIDASRQAAAR
jgi:putative oxidoreductase